MLNVINVNFSALILSVAMFNSIGAVIILIVFFVGFINIF